MKTYNTKKIAVLLILVMLTSSFGMLVSASDSSTTDEGSVAPASIVCCENPYPGEEMVSTDVSNFVTYYFNCYTHLRREGCSHATKTNYHVIFCGNCNAVYDEYTDTELIYNNDCHH
ncbi:MAG TPA: hypothetical protein VEB00_03600 [Clostridia bacterium]|nr:hypothetical protein [Clostridia bacterium]